ncbi:hypothetical protein IGJ83_003225 [Enterococcus pernyi]|uniref:Gram-positive cocci surface proteins LPxTG domain-containing protein n=1 Tax=Candidatus Enterococcus mangumiae TaxID=2230878 RepID=A0ABZ2SZ86_9ENTE|nr:LPXTG cell wall anchor domain-containing protein [Enterococcus sp. DIV1094]MBO0490045.1 LPXTG cell wall anchor domain-containing protein [Enterococcus sp. DIV1094]
MKKKKKFLLTLFFVCSLFMVGGTVEAASSAHTSHAGIYFNGYDGSWSSGDINQSQPNIEIPGDDGSVSGGKMSQGTLPKTNTISHVSMFWLGVLLVSGALYTFMKRIQIIGGKLHEK